jgi:hypothetical protein
MKSIATRASILGLLACLAGCTTLQGKLEGHSYTSPDGEFSVKVPNPMFGSDATDGLGGPDKRYVDFAFGGYWMAEGGYSVEWYKLDKPYAADADFIKATREFLPSLMTHSLNPSFKPLDIQELQVNGHAAVRLVAEGMKDSIDAYWVATSIDFGDRIAISLLLIPKQHEPQYSGPPSGDAAPLYGDYPAFTDSIVRH